MRSFGKIMGNLATLFFLFSSLFLAKSAPTQVVSPFPHAYTVDQSPNTIPALKNFDTNATIQLPQLAQGSWYLHVRSPVNPNTVIHRKFNILRQPPAVKATTLGNQTMRWEWTPPNRE